MLKTFTARFGRLRLEESGKGAFPRAKWADRPWRLSFRPVGLYDRFVLPFVIDKSCGLKSVTLQRSKVIGKAYGTVLEVGIGSGHNLPLYDAEKVTKILGVDPSVELGSKAKRRAEKLPFPVDLRLVGGEAIAEPESVDTVVFTYTLCSVSSVPDVLAAARSALKPDGLLLFCEHALAPDESVQIWQRRLEPAWMALAGGCHLTRDVVALLGAAGFRIEELEQAYMPRSPRFVGFHQIGTARRA